MLKQSCFNAEAKRGFSLRGFVNKLISYKAFAEEVAGDESGINGSKSPQVNYEQLIAQARKEEKDKLYPRITKLEEEKRQMVESVNSYLIQIASLQEELRTLKAKDGDTTEIDKLTKKVADLEKEKEDILKSTPDAETLKAQIKAEVEKEYEVKLYVQEQLTANKDEILSVFQAEVSGKTKEEVDEAVKNAKTKSLAIKKDLGLVDKDGKPIGKKEKQPNPAGKQAKLPASAPSEEVGDEEYDAEYVRNLDPRSDEYKTFRKKLGLH